MKASSNSKRDTHKLTCVRGGWFRALSAVIVLSLAPALALGDPCRNLAPQFFTNERDVLAHELHAKGIPLMSKKLPGGKIPVVLVNTKTVDELKPLLTRSIGTVTQLQPRWRNDHGMLRIADKLIDADTPGARGYGELHQTGLSWKEIVNNTHRQNEQSPVRIEVAFMLTEAELNNAEYYQRVRRSAIFRVPFTLGGNTIDLSKPNSLATGGEHCFLFCKGSSLGAQLSAIEAEMNKMGMDDVHSFKNKPRTQEFLNEVRGQILSWSVKFSEADVTADAFQNSAIANMHKDGIPILEYYKDIFPAGMSSKSQLILSNWLVGHDAATQYQALLKSLGVNSGVSFAEMNLPRASFVLIYDHTPTAEPSFQNGSYTTKGIFSSWTNKDQEAFRAGN